MLIFDRFPNQSRAQAFADYCIDHFGRNADVFKSQQESNKVDPFPYQLTAPIVLVERDGDEGPELEPTIEQAVTLFGGTFAGT